MQTTLYVWLGIIFCVTQSAIFSGLNLAFFSLAKLRLEMEAEIGNIAAKRVLIIRQNSNFLLTTILWGNVGINVLLTLLSNSVLAGLSAFVFSTVVITFLGEIFPQAYFSRNALKMASLLTPLLKVYQFILYPVAKPTAMILDLWLGKESIHLFQEESIKYFIKKHIEEEGNEIDQIEGTGAINFLNIDDLPIKTEGEIINKKSIIKVNKKLFKELQTTKNETFLKKVNQSGEKWVILINENGSPFQALDADAYLRALCFENKTVNIKAYCHKPIIITDAEAPLGLAIAQLKKNVDAEDDSAIEKDILILWASEKRIITGADILGRLLKNISI